MSGYTTTSKRILNVLWELQGNCLNYGNLNLTLDMDYNQISFRLPRLTRLLCRAWESWALESPVPQFWYWDWDWRGLHAIIDGSSRRALALGCCGARGWKITLPHSDLGHGLVRGSVTDCSGVSVRTVRVPVCENSETLPSPNIRIAILSGGLRADLRVVSVSWLSFSNYSLGKQKAETLGERKD